MSGTFCYDRPTVSNANQPPKGFRPALGGFEVTVTGKGFGIYDSGQVVGVVSSFYGGDAISASTTWTSDSSILLSAPAGVGVGRQVSVLVGGQRSAGDRDAKVDYDAPYVRRVRPALGPRAGDRRVTLQGSGFGPAPPPDSMGSLGGPAGGPPSVITDGETSPSSATNSSKSTDASGGPPQSENQTNAGGDGNATASGGNATDAAPLPARRAVGKDQIKSVLQELLRAGTHGNENEAEGEKEREEVDEPGAQVKEQGRRSSAPKESQTSSAAVQGKVRSIQGMVAKIGDTECLQTEWISQTAAACLTRPGQGTFLPARIMVGEQWSAEPDPSDLWHAPTFSFVGSSIKITALLSRTVGQFERMGGQAQFSAAIAARLLAECVTFDPEACGSAFRKSQVMFTSDPMSYAQWCNKTSGCVGNGQEQTRATTTKTKLKRSEPHRQDRHREGTGSEDHPEDPLLLLLRQRSNIDHSWLVGRRSAAGGEGNVAQEAAGNVSAEAGSLRESAVVEFQLLGSESSPDSHTGALSLLYRIGIDGYLWALGIRAVKLEGKKWELAHQDCPHGDRYNDLPCAGRGRCVRGVCLCGHMYSGDRCQVKGSFPEETLQTWSLWTRLIAAGILAVSVLAHFLAWVVAGGLFCKQVLVAGDYWSFLLHLQFIGLTSYLDTSLPDQYFQWASAFRVFNIQFDPKEVFEAWGFKWGDYFPLPLTNFCYKEAAVPEYRTSADLSKLGGGNASAISFDTLAEFGIHTKGSELKGHVAADSGYQSLRYRKMFMGPELVEGWGGKVGLNKDRGALEISFRLLCSTLVCCYGIVIFSFLTRCAFAKLVVHLRKKNSRTKKIRYLQKIEDKERKKMKMSAEEVIKFEEEERQQAEHQAAEELAKESECYEEEERQQAVELKEISVVAKDFGYRWGDAEKLKVEKRTARESIENGFAAYDNRQNKHDAEDGVQTGNDADEETVQKNMQTVEDWQRWICAEEEEDWWEVEKTEMRQLKDFERLTKTMFDGEFYGDDTYDRSDPNLHTDAYDRSYPNLNTDARLHSASLSGGSSEAFSKAQTGSRKQLQHGRGPCVHVNIAGANLGQGFDGKQEIMGENQQENAGPANGAEPGAEANKLEGADSDLKCALCQEIGHSYKNCEYLSTHLEERRTWIEMAPPDLSFPRWELPLMTFIISGVVSCTGAVIGAAGPAGCPMLYVSLVALIPIVAFQIWVFTEVQKHVFSITEKRVWWRAHDFEESRMDKIALQYSNWPRSRLKANLDYWDSLTTSGWWEESVRLSITTEIGEDGQERIIKGGQWLSEEECMSATNTVCREAALVPALFLRSRQGMEAASKAGELKHFLLKAKEKLASVVFHVSDIELRRMGVKEPAIILNWSTNAVESLWPSNEDCYRRAIYEGQRPDVVNISSAIKKHLTNTLLTVKGMAETEFTDPHGLFLLRYRTIFKRLAGQSHWQVHYLSIQVGIRFLTAFFIGFLSGPVQGVVLVCVNVVDLAVLAGMCPFKNRLQNFKHLSQSILRTFLLLLALMTVPRGKGFETNEAANEGTFVTLLLLGAAIDAVSPMLGGLRALIGSVPICCGLHRRGVIHRHRHIAAFVKFCIGQQRSRTAMYLKTNQLKRAYKTWEDIRAEKEIKMKFHGQKKHKMEALVKEEEEKKAIKDSGLAELRDSIALQKWLGVYIYIICTCICIFICTCLYACMYVCVCVYLCVCVCA